MSGSWRHLDLHQTDVQIFRLRLGVGQLPIKVQAVNILGFVGCTVCLDDTALLWEWKVTIGNTEMNEHGCVEIQLCIWTWTFELHIPFSGHKILFFWFFFSTIWSKVNIRMAFIPFLARGLYKNRQQITFGLWAIVCQPLIKIVDQKFLMLFQSIQENQNDPGAFILATHFQVGLFKNSWKL